MNFYDSLYVIYPHISKLYDDKVYIKIHIYYYI